MIKKSTFLLCLVIFFTGLYASLIFAQSENKVSIAERTDYSVYKNGRYIGLNSRESKSYIIEKRTSPGIINYSGETFVLQNTKHNRKKIAKSIDEILKIDFILNQNIPEEDIENPYQPQIFIEDSGYPILRNFPLLPNREFNSRDIGKTWVGKSTVVVRPISEKPASRIAVFVEYQYKGILQYQGKNVHHVKAQFGLRYKGNDELGDPEMLRSNGGRKLDIYLDAKNRPLRIIENLNENFFYQNGESIGHKGFILHFYSYSNMNTNVKQNEIKATKNFSVHETERGTMLNLKNLNFVANEAILLKGEEEKLDEIASVLKKTKASFFMIEGHTADIGEYKAQKKLSLERAKTIANELIKRGIPAKKLITRGAGASKPIADNKTEEGRAKNRRVEITIF